MKRRGAIKAGIAVLLLGGVTRPKQRIILRLESQGLLEAERIRDILREVRAGVERDRGIITLACPVPGEPNILTTWTGRRDDIPAEYADWEEYQS